MTDNHETGAADDPDPDQPTEWHQVEQHHYDPDEDGELTTAIVFTIAAARGVSPVDVRSPPLYECVDAHSLAKTLFGPNVSDADPRGVRSVEFRYAEFLVNVRSDGWIQVYESAEATA